MKKHTQRIVILFLAAALLCLSGCSQKFETRDYNTMATNSARLVKYIGSWEILLLDTMEKNDVGLYATFKVYTVDAIQDPNDFLGLTAAEAEGNAALKYIGIASATFLGGELDNVQYLEVVLNQ